MRSPSTFTFVSLVLMTLCTTKPAPPAAGSSEATASVRKGVVHVPERTARTRVVIRHPS